MVFFFFNLLTVYFCNLVEFENPKYRKVLKYMNLEPSKDIICV